MVDFLRDFIHILRSSDIRISTAESIDAMRVVSLIGIDDKPLLQDSLSQTLAKNLREKEIFDECFNKFFEENYMNCMLQKALKDRVTVNRCNLDSVLWFQLECPRHHAKFDNPIEFKRKWRDFFAITRSYAAHA